MPLLPTAIFHLVGATSFGPAAAFADGHVLARCAAQLAEAPRDPACTPLNQTTWEPDDGEIGRLICLDEERIFDKGWSAEDVAQVLLVHLAARIVQRHCKHYERDGRWLFGLERAMRARALRAVL